MVAAAIWASLLLWLAWEDWQNRSVSLWALLLAGGAGFYVHYVNWTPGSALFNIGFLLVQYMFLLIYFRWRSQRWQWLLGTMLGWGDVVFVLVSAFFLPTLLFLVTYLLGLIGTLLVVYLSGVYRQRNFAIPLITGLALGQLAGVSGMYLF